MLENYTVAVKISLVNHVSAGLLLLSRQFATTDAAAARLQQRLDSIALSARKGAYLVGGGAALAAPFIFAIDKAAELQKQMIAIQIATRGTTSEMDKMRGAIEGIAGQTIFSNIDVARMGKLVATGTGFGAGQVTSLLPVFARFADVQTLMKGTPFEESVTNLIRLAHTAQHYDAPGLTKYADLLTKASFIVPGGLGEIGHALKYSQGIAKTALGVDDESMVLMTALLNRLGLSGSRGGTNLLAAMTRTIPGVFGSGLLKGKSAEALAAMGMVDGHGHAKVFKDGKFDPITWMGLMADYVSREFAAHPEGVARQDIMKNFQHAYGVQGSRVASLLASPQALDQFRQISATFSEYGGVEGVQRRFANDSVAQQWLNAKTNFTSAMTELGMTLLPMASRALKALNSELQKLITWITKHQTATKVLATAFLGLAGAMAFGGTVLLLSAALRGLGVAVQFAAGGVATAMGRLGLIGATGAAAYATGTYLNNHFIKGTKADTILGNMVGGAMHLFGFQRAEDLLAHGRHHGFDYGGINRPIQVNVHMDGKKVATVVTKHQARAASAPQTGIAEHDERMSLAPAGF